MANAGLTGVDVGVSYPSIAGQQAATFTSELGYRAKVFLDSPIEAEGLEFFGAVAFQPFKVKTFAAARLYFFDAAIGFKTSAESTWVLSPGLAAQVGFVSALDGYDTTTTVTRNFQTYLSTTVTPSVDFPISGQLGGSIQMPVQFVFVSGSTFTTWNSALSLRWKL